MPCPSQYSRFKHSNYIRWTVQTMKFLVVEPAPLSVTEYILMKGTDIIKRIIKLLRLNIKHKSNYMCSLMRSGPTKLKIAYYKLIPITCLCFNKYLYLYLFWLGGHCCPMHCDDFKIYCAPLNLGIRPWICRLNFAERPIFSGMRFFNEPEISDSGPPA